MSISEKQALAGARRVFRTNLALLGLAFFVALASAIFIGNGVIVGRLASLVSASRELGKGHLEARTGLPHGPDELGLLARAFDEMAETLEQKESDGMRAEEALRESEEQFRLLFEKSGDPSLLLDGDAYIDCNEAALRLMGFSGKDRLVGLRVSDTSPVRQPDGCLSSEKIRQINEITLKEGVNHFEWMLRTVLGEELWVDVSQTVIPIRGRQIKYTVWRDIRQRKEAEKALHESRLHLSEAMDLARIVYWEADPTTGEYIFNDPFYAFYGTTAEGEGGYRMSREEYGRRFVHPDDRPLFQQASSRDSARRECEFLHDVEHRIIRRDGQVRHIVARRRLIRDEAGQVIRRYGATQDVTERKRTEDELREKEIRFRMIFEDSPTGMVMANADYRFTRANPAFCRMLGLNRGELASLTFKEVTHPAHVGEDAARIADVSVERSRSTGRKSVISGRTGRSCGVLPRSAPSATKTACSSTSSP